MNWSWKFVPKYRESFVIAQDGEILISRVINHLHWKFQDYKIFSHNTYLTLLEEWKDYHGYQGYHFN